MNLPALLLKKYRTTYLLILLTMIFSCTRDDENYKRYGKFYYNIELLFQHGNTLTYYLHLKNIDINDKMLLNDICTFLVCFEKHESKEAIKGRYSVNFDKQEIIKSEELKLPVKMIYLISDQGHRRNKVDDKYIVGRLSFKDLSKLELYIFDKKFPKPDTIINLNDFGLDYSKIECIEYVNLFNPFVN